MFFNLNIYPKFHYVCSGKRYLTHHYSLLFLCKILFSVLLNVRFMNNEWMLFGKMIFISAKRTSWIKIGEKIIDLATKAPNKH